MKKLVLKKKIKIIVLILLIVFVLVARYKYSSHKKNIIVKDHKKVVFKDKKYKASLIMVGDALIHSTVYIDAKQDDGSYDFKPMIELIKPMVKDYDLKYYNQETILGGVELGLSNYPRFNSPREVGDAFLDAGFNLVSLANNHTMDKGEIGVNKSLEYWNAKNNVVTAGQYLSFEERDEEKVYEVNGIKYAFFSYTTWTNGLETPEGKEYLNNVYSNELAQKNIEAVRDKADVVIVAMHWGTEYSNGVDSSQEEIANFLSSLGVDIIIGTHPHVIEPVEYIGKTLVIYSLGNFISDQLGNDRLTGLIFSLDINKEVKKDNTEISIDNLKANLCYTYSRYGKNFKVYPYNELNTSLFPDYVSYYNKYRDIVTSRYSDIVFTPLESE